MSSLIDELWTLERLYDEVLEHDHHQRQITKYKKLGKKIES
jgi:hypothetical protein